MQFDGRTVFTTILKQGILLHFAPGTIFGSETWHYAVVVNSDPVRDEAVIVACATSKYEKRKRLAERLGFPPETVVHLPSGAHPKFMDGKTGFDCNHVKKVTLDDLSRLYGSNKVKLVRNNGDLNQKYIDEIIEGILRSDVVASNIRSYFNA